MSQEQQRPPIIHLQAVPAGVEMILQGLNKLPREMSDGLFQEIAGQYGYQLQELQKQHEAEQKAAKEAADKAAKEAALKAKKTPAKKAVPSTPAAPAAPKVTPIKKVKK